MNSRHDWLVALVAVAVSIVVNLIIYAYGQGAMEHRVETLEKQAERLKEDWKDARERIEKALKEKP